MDQGQLAKYFPEEEAGWHGYVEWEKYPERKQKAHEILKKMQDEGKFTPDPEFQFVPMPKTNPILVGHRFKEYYAALGPTLKNRPEESWQVVQKEKASDMLVVLDFPYNGEPPKMKCIEDKITPNEYHFVRNHGDIPIINADKYFVEVGGLVNKPQKFTLKDLQDESKFPQMEMTITIQCAGTRRVEQIAQYPGAGDELINAPWAEGAIGTAKYRGISLKKVLKYCGIKQEALHIEFFGADTYFKETRTYNFGSSVPWRKVKSNEVMLAWEMNGKPLPHIHGFPLRVVVAGYIGARSVKWLTHINAIPEMSMSPVQRQEYIYFYSQIGKHNLAFSSGFSIQDMPVASAIMNPVDLQTVIHNGHITVQGWAYSGGGRWIERVEVSPDGGHIWYPVDVDDMTTKHYHAWRLWKIELPVIAEGWLDVCVRAWDNSCNTQPTTVREAWNWALHVTSSCHRIRVYSVNRNKKRTADRLVDLEKRGISLDPITEPLPFEAEKEEDFARNVKKYTREPID